MAKTKLSVKYEFDFTLIGINANVKPHKLAWALNNALNLEFARISDLEIEFKKGKKLRVLQFLHRDDYGTYRILKNRSEMAADSFDAFLLPELKQFDYLLLLENESTTFDENVFFKKIKQIPFVQLTIKVDLHTLKSRENLIF